MKYSTSNIYIINWFYRQPRPIIKKDAKGFGVTWNKRERADRNFGENPRLVCNYTST